jgi:hypothetical protein
MLKSHEIPGYLDVMESFAFLNPFWILAGYDYVFRDVLMNMPVINCRCGVLTVEIEHVDVETLEELESEGVDIEPKPITIRIIQVHIFMSTQVS